MASARIASNPALLTDGSFGQYACRLAALVRCHGSVKQMEQLVGVGYARIENRVDRIAEQFAFIDVTPPKPADDVTSELGRGAITVEQTVQMLRK